MIWRGEIGEENHTKSCFVFLSMLANRKLSLPESVRRCWQKILEERPELRGPKYNERHKIAAPKVKKEIKQLKKHLKHKDQEKLEL